MENITWFFSVSKSCSATNLDPNYMHHSITVALKDFFKFVKECFFQLKCLPESHFDTVLSNNDCNNHPKLVCNVSVKISKPLPNSDTQYTAVQVCIATYSRVSHSHYLRIFVHFFVDGRLSTCNLL